MPWMRLIFGMRIQSDDGDGGYDDWGGGKAEGLGRWFCLNLLGFGYRCVGA